MTEPCEDYRAALLRLYEIMQEVSEMPLGQWLQAIEHAEAMGPVVAPTLWIRQSKAMGEDKAVIEAAMPLCRLGRDLKARGLRELAVPQGPTS